MKNVIVHPALSYTVLAAGTLIALACVWKAYEVAAYVADAERAEAAYYNVVR